MMNVKLDGDRIRVAKNREDARRWALYIMERRATPDVLAAAKAALDAWLANDNCSYVPGKPGRVPGKPFAFTFIDAEGLDRHLTLTLYAPQHVTRKWLLRGQANGHRPAQLKRP